MSRLFRGVHPFDLYKFTPDPDGGEDTHGNPIGEVSETPVAPQPKAIAIYPAGGITGRMMKEPVTVDEAGRYIDELLMLVEDPTIIGNQDEVEIGGVRYEVAGDPGADGDWRKGPFAKYNRLFGGMVNLKKVG